MTATINVHGPYEYAPHHYEAKGGDPEYVSLWISAPGTLLHLYFHTRAGCDELIRGAQQAKDLLPEDAPGGAS